jgi:hypothetical protein
MARLGRYFLPDQPLHVIQRGNNRDAIFFAEDDYACYRGSAQFHDASAPDQSNFARNGERLSVAFLSAGSSSSGSGRQV